jgi:hypothetical protein
MDIDSLSVGQARYGLAFNRNINWSNKVIEMFKDDFFFDKDEARNYTYQILEQVMCHFYFEDLRYTKKNFIYDILSHYDFNEYAYYNRLFDNFETYFSRIELALV